ncbi:hypothetical protein [Pelagicoccus mobilis]|nr:hypothetical protein [Pelagicoccus mobilis]
MADSNTDGSIFTEMAARRSRSDELQAKAIEQGLVVEQVVTAAPEELSVEAEPDMKPAFDMESFESSLVSENELQPVETEETPESLLEIPADPVSETLTEAEEPIRSLDTEPGEHLPTEVEATPEAEVTEEFEASDGEADVDEPILAEVEAEVDVDSSSEVELEAEEEPVSQSAEETVAAKEVVESPEGVEAGEISEELPEEEGSASQEDLIEQSGDLLGEAPEPISDAEVIMAAEELVDRIGSVVDIQSLPKTQPSRVLSKVAKSEENEEKKAEPEAIRLPEENEAPKSVESAAEPEPSPTKPKKKKKKVSLLDSYFKGL